MAAAAEETAFLDFKMGATTWESTAAAFSILVFKKEAAASTPTARMASRPKRFDGGIFFAVAGDSVVYDAGCMALLWVTLIDPLESSS